MFGDDANAVDAGSRRRVLTLAGGLVAGSTALAGFGAGRGAAETEEGLRVELREMTESYVAVEVRFPEETFVDEVEFPTDIFLGHAERFVVHEEEGTVSLPEDVEGLADPVHFERVNERGEWPRRYPTYFRTEAVDLSAAQGEEVTLRLGLFPERTVPLTYSDRCPGPRDY